MVVCYNYTQKCVRLTYWHIGVSQVHELRHRRHTVVVESDLLMHSLREGVEVELIDELLAIRVDLGRAERNGGDRGVGSSASGSLPCVAFRSVARRRSSTGS